MAFAIPFIRSWTVPFLVEALAMAEALTCGPVAATTFGGFF
jgi:hypothetical protein